MDGTRNYFFSGACVSENQNGKARPANPSHQPMYLPHRRRIADERGKGRYI
jgi:hypothetical protein